MREITNKDSKEQEAEKYGSKEVFDLYFYSDEELLFSIDTAKSMVINSHRRTGNNELTIRDGLIDNDLMNNIVNGLYDGVNFKIIGESFYRGTNGEDKKVSLVINNSTIDKYGCSYDVEYISSPILVVKFPSRYDKADNFKISIEGEGANDK